MIQTEEATRWRAVGTARCASSTAELLQVADAAVEQLFDMKLRMKPGVLRTLVDGFDVAAGQYAKQTADALPDPKVGLEGGREEGQQRSRLPWGKGAVGRLQVLR